MNGLAKAILGAAVIAAGTEGPWLFDQIMDFPVDLHRGRVILTEEHVEVMRDEARLLV